MSLVHEERSGAHPLDVIEVIAGSKEWQFQRDEDTLSFYVEGGCAEYNLVYSWLTDIDVLHLACSFQLKVPAYRQPAVQELIMLINERLWLGHFDPYFNDGMIMFRHGTMLCDCEPDPLACEQVVTAALETCERFYAAFQYVVWAGKSGQEAIKAAAFATEGNA
jgi:hypothetical protein